MNGGDSKTEQEGHATAKGKVIPNFCGNVFRHSLATWNRLRGRVYSVRKTTRKVKRNA